jgi:hypothetical protein
MEDHETRRKIIREWMALPKEKRQTEEQVAAFAKKAAQQNEFHRSRRDPARSVPEINGMAFAARWQIVIRRLSRVRDAACCGVLGLDRVAERSTSTFGTKRTSQSH